MMVNKKWVKILKAARKRIEIGESRFVCLAIDKCRLGLFGSLYLGAKSKLKREIMIRLDGSHTVCGWLASKDFELWESFEDDFTQYRLAWIDSMIEEFSGTGKFAPVITWAD